MYSWKRFTKACTPGSDGLWPIRAARPSLISRPSCWMRFQSSFVYADVFRLLQQLQVAIGIEPVSGSRLIRRIEQPNSIVVVERSHAHVGHVCYLPDRIGHLCSFPLSWQHISCLLYTSPS